MKLQSNLTTDIIESIISDLNCQMS